MARAPRAKIPKTSGQGVSRLSYQRGYDLAHKGDAPKITGGGSRAKPDKVAKIQGSRTEYDKGGDKKSSSGVNIAPYLPSDIRAIEDFGRGVSNRSSVKLEPGEVKKLRK